MKHIKKLINGAIFIAVITLFTGCGFTNPSTPAGHEGYVFEDPRIWGKGGFQGTVEGPGNFGISLWRNRTENFDMRPKTYTEPFEVLASDDLNMSFSVDVIIDPKDGSSKEIMENFGGQTWYNTYVKKPMRSFVRDSD